MDDPHVADRLNKIKKSTVGMQLAAIGIVATLAIGVVFGSAAFFRTYPQSEQHADSANAVNERAKEQLGAHLAEIRDVPDRPERTAAVNNRRNGDEPRQTSNATEIVFATRDGRGVSGILVAIAVHDPEVTTEAMHVLTGAAGSVRVAARASQVSLRIESPDWRLAYTDPVKEDGWIAAPLGLPCVVRVERLRTMAVKALYADGTAFEGVLSVTSRADSDGLTIAHEVRSGGIEVPVPADGPFSIVAASGRPGFAHGIAESTPAVPLPDSITLRLEATAPTAGVIEIDLSAFSNNSRVCVRVDGVLYEYDTPYRRSVVGGGHHTTAWLRPGTYRVRVLDDADGYYHKNGMELPPSLEPASVRCWESEPVVLAAGATIKVVAMPQQASAVRARLVDSRGVPLVPGRLYVQPDHMRPTYWSEVREKYVYGTEGLPSSRKTSAEITDLDGSAVAPVIVPGTRTIAAEAPGFDVKLVEVECISGQTHDLGIIVLEPATGAIDVNITNWNPEFTYTVTLRGFGGGILGDKVKMTSSTHRFTGLAVRWYTVSVENEDRKVGAWSRTVKLSTTKPTAVVEFEMLRPPLPPRPPKSEE